MPAQDAQQCTYAYPFELVTLSLWHKYDAHPWVKNADVLDRRIDERGRLHSKRLLTIEGGIPWIFRSIIPVNQLHIVEDSVVDAKSRTMHVVTRNVSFNRAFVAEGQSNAPGHTDFSMTMIVTAWVGLLSHRFENFLLPRMAGNAQQGQLAVSHLCAELSRRYPLLGATK